MIKVLFAQVSTSDYKKNEIRWGNIPLQKLFNTDITVN